MKSLVFTIGLTISLVALPVQAGDGTTDYRGTIEERGAAYTISVHKGASRIDSPHRKGVVSDYGAPAQLPRMFVFRDSTGQVSLVVVTGPNPLWPALKDEWEATGERRTLAGEECAVQQRVGRKEANHQRCITADGLLLAFYRDYGPKVLKTVERGPVSAAEVRPPVELFDLKRWGLSKALLAKPAGRGKADYEAVFELGGDTVTFRRSGAWTSEIRTGTAPSTRLVNEQAGIMIATTHFGAPELRLRRATTESVLWPFPARPATVNGVASQTVKGETCHWQSRSISPDAAELECRTEDGAVLGVGFSGNSGEVFSLPLSFVRKPFALAAIMPDASHYQPETYGFRRER